MNAALLGLLLFASCVNGLGFVNSQTSTIPMYSKKGHAVGMVDPRMKFAPTYVQELEVWHDNVLLSLEQANHDQEWSDQHAIVVRAGGKVKSALLTEGARVLINTACTTLWTQATFQAKYPLHATLSKSMEGKYVNGVSLNNGWGWTLNDRTDVVNSNQQYNYLVCKESAILGVIEEESFGANRADKFTSRILKPTFGSKIHPEFWLAP
eukprot:NODE_1895_length_817_cov_307.023438_g1495_i0.p1 GENE.NODE_1895_length_817_cov_307.023438_g1495_i0~~NODE_1895_length_817_cov_307.023438_g1495_i0.p1  ORF type:complete len:229 (-),score=59.32 NODE_1895_length_817_cov_307.023438_g1495_i0:130-756(-)